MATAKNAIANAGFARWATMPTNVKYGSWQKWMPTMWLK